MRRIVLFATLWLCGAQPIRAMVGDAPLATADAGGRSAVLLVGSRGNSCTGVAIARDLVLTAAHCVLPGADYKLVEIDAARRPTLRDVKEVARHPQFALKSLLAHRATADIALLKLAAPLATTVGTAKLASSSQPPQAGDAFTVAGYGVTVPGDGRSGGTLRSATLVATGRPGNLQLRLVDPRTKGERAGLGACTGDSGAPVFDGPGRLVGVVSWSTAANNAAGCGGLTGVTPLALYRDWIVDTARKMASPIAD